MSHHRRAGRGFALGFIAVLVVSAMLPMTALAAKPTQPRLGLHDEQLLAKARIEGRETVTILLAAKGGAARQAEAAVTECGRHDPLSRRRARLHPRRRADRQGQGGRRELPGVEAVDLDEVDPVAGSAARGRKPGRAAAGTRCGNAAGQPVHADPGHRRSAFVNAHPTWDGRGVTIGIVDTGQSLDHPSLLRRAPASARSSTGLRAPTRSPTTTRRGSTWPTRSAAGERSRRRRHVHGAGQRHVPLRSSARTTRGSAASTAARTSTATATAPATSDVFGVLWNTHVEPGLRRHEPGPQLRRPGRR